MMNPEGGYFDRGGKALEIVPEGLQGRQNLVDWHDVSDYWDMRRSLPDAPSSGKGWLYFGASVCHGDGPFGTYSSCTKTTMVEHIVHIDGAPEPSARSAG